MTAEPVRPRPGLGQGWRTAVLTALLGALVLAAPRAGRADPPLYEDMNGSLSWFRHVGSAKSHPAPTPPPPCAPTASPWPEEMAFYLEWYRQAGAAQPRPAPPTPQPALVVSTRDSRRADATRYLEALRHNGAPKPRPASVNPGPSPPVVVTVLDVVPIHDPAVKPASALVYPPAYLPPLDEEPPLAPAAPPARLAPLAPPPAPTIAVAEEVTPVGCSSCGQGGGLLFPGPGSGGATAAAGGCGCGSGNCVPGRADCVPCQADTAVGRFLCGVYECLCCPDPCYEPKWLPLADSAFFVESARPQTQQRIRWDSGFNLNHPDAGEYFWARADGKGRGPNPANHNHAPGVLGEINVNYNQMSLYTEGAIGNIGTFVEMPYLSLDGEVMGHAANFGDMNLGTKTLIFDCELLQVAFEFRTTLPTGNFTKGLGTGHVSLEPGLLIGLKLGPDTYMQGQIAEWIPLGGDPSYQGAILHYHTSVNHVLCRILPNVPLIGTLEFNGWSFQHGEFTDPVFGGDQRVTGETYLSMGPGLRLFICDKVDFGVGTAFALTDRHWASQVYRTELRWRF